MPPLRVTALFFDSFAAKYLLIAAAVVVAWENFVFVESIEVENGDQRKHLLTLFLALSFAAFVIQCTQQTYASFSLHQTIFHTAAGSD